MRFLLPLLLILSSCSPQQQLSRLQSKHPELFKHDTIFKTDTFIAIGTRIDTAFLDGIHDTVTLAKDNLIIKYVNVAHKVYLSGTVTPDTVIRTEKVIVNSFSPYQPTKWQRIQEWGFWLLLIALLLVVLAAYFLRQIRK